MCQTKARSNYPLIKQYDLIKQSETFNLANAQKGYLPQVTISAKATYQSDVTAVPINLPNMKIEGLDKDQYQAVAEVSQTLWDGGMIRSQKQNIQASTEVEKQRIEVDMYALNERVNQLFFGILLLKEQLTQNDLLQKELQNNFDRISAYKQNGIANQSDVDAIKVEQLKTKQRRAELVATQKSYREMLAAMLGTAVSENESFIKPQFIVLNDSVLQINRPELKLFEAQTHMNESQKSTILSANLPKINLFVQGGIGKPGLNMLKNEFSPFYIGGIRLAWNLGGFYTQKNNLSKIEINKQMVEVQKETFLYNTKLKISQQNNEISKIREIISNDDEIITLRKSIKQSAENKVENGTLSVTDLIREINAENLALQDKSLHEIQLLIAVYNLKNTTNQ